MDYKRTALKNGVGLNVISTDKFKTGFLSINFIRALDEKENAKNALLMQVLRRGSAMYENQRAINLKLSENYGATVEALIRKRGEFQIFGLYGMMINNAFAFSGEDIFSDTVAVMEELLFNPKIENSAFDAQYVESEKRNLKDKIAALIDDKVSYATVRAQQIMCEGEPFALSEYGTAEAVDEITPESLYEHYKKIIKEAKIEVFYVGSEDSAKIENSLKKTALLEMRDNVELAAPFVTGDVSELKNIEEKMDVAQGKLAIGCRTGIVEGDRLYPALYVANAVFGATPVSKLFMNVREKLSLCYYVRSRINKLKGIMIISAGIENENLEVTKKEIEVQLNAMKNGDFTDDEIAAARAALRNGINSMLDSGYETESYYLTKTLNGDKSTPADLLSAIEKVTREEIIEASQHIKYDTVYFLRGTMGGSNE